MPNLLSIDEVVKIIEASQGITKAMLTLMYSYGLRSREVTGLQIEDVDFKKLSFNIKEKQGSGNISNDSANRGTAKKSYW